MAILVDKSSRILIQGITGATGRAFAERMVRFSAGLVAGVTPGKGGQIVARVPVFDSVAEAQNRTGATCSLIVVPPDAALGAVMEAADSGIRLAVVYTEGVPIQDAAKACAYARGRGMVVCGPNSAGVVSPGQANMSDLNDANLKPGAIGIVSKSGTLTYEVIFELGRRALGTSTIVCLGGDPVVGLDYATVLEFFDKDEETDAVVMIGEIGGRAEVDAADVIRRMRKPVIPYVAGRSAPSAKRMGHAGAIIRSSYETAEAKAHSLAQAGALAVPSVLAIAPMVQSLVHATARRT